MVGARAGVRHTLQEISDNGHCAVPRGKLAEESAGLPEIPVPIVDEAIREEVEEGNLAPDRIDGRGCLFLAPLHRAETGTAAGIRQWLLN